MINLNQSPKERWQFIQNQIQLACKRSNRSISDITLLGASKGQSLEHVKAFLDLGLNHIGENYLQEAEQKVPELSTYKPTIQKHFIGHLQTNKVKKVLQIFDCIESADSIKLIQEIDKRFPQVYLTPESGKDKFPVFIEVNLSGDDNKTGCKPVELFDIVNYISDQTQFVECRGLMTISPLNMVDEVALHNFFSEMHSLFEKVQSTHPNCSELSMGMSDDFEIAIEEGSTMIRIGTLLFGPRT